MTITEIKAAVQSTIDQYGDPERRYTFVCDIGLTDINIYIEGLSVIKVGKGNDPTVSRDPVGVNASLEEYIPYSCNERVIKAFVRAMIEEIEETEIKYE